MTKFKQRAVVVMAGGLLSAFGLVLYLAQGDDAPKLAKQSAQEGGPKKRPAGLSWQSAFDNGVPTSTLGSEAVSPPDEWADYSQLLLHGSQEAIRARALSDATFRKFLIDRSSTAKDLDERGMMLAVLAASRHEDVRKQALAWINAGSAELRRQGFQLLQGYDLRSPETLSTVMQALQREASPEVLQEALRTLPADVALVGDAESVAARLKMLVTHADPGVRSQSLTQLVRWETDATVVQGALLNGLRDSDVEVRQASLAALEASGLRSDAIKQALLNIAQNTNDGFSARSDALSRLNAYRLNEDERQRFNAARESVNQQYQVGEKSG